MQPKHLLVLHLQDSGGKVLLKPTHHCKSRIRCNSFRNQKQVGGSGKIAHFALGWHTVQVQHEGNSLRCGAQQHCSQSLQKRGTTSIYTQNNSDTPSAGDLTHRPGWVQTPRKSCSPAKPELGCGGSLWRFTPLTLTSTCHQFPSPLLLPLRISNMDHPSCLVLRPALPSAPHYPQSDSLPPCTTFLV